MSNYPDDEGRDYVAELLSLAGDELASYQSDPGALPSLVRCACGTLVSVVIPCVCTCGKQFAYWKTLEGEVKPLSTMGLGHLNNCVRTLAAKAEKYPPELRGKYETALDLLYLEIGSRDKEIAQVSGIMAAIQRSLA